MIESEAISIEDVAATVGPPDPSVIEQEIDGCFALLHSDRGQVVILNQTASDIWRLSDGNLTVEAMVGLLARAYDTKEDVIRDEVESTVSSLTDLGFFETRK
jgi:hypothetical protein